MTRVGTHNLHKIISPKSIAIIGASDNPDKVGHVIIKNNIDSGYGGKIYPININSSGTIMGYKSYKSILEVKKQIDLAVIAIPAEFVPDALEQCGRAKVGGVVIISGGFAEIGRIDLQEKVVEISEKYNLPVIGPNCLGVTDTRSRVDTLFLPTFKIDRPSIGGVSFAAQSGAVGSSVLDLIDSEGFGLARFFSYGNAAVVDEVDILDFLAKDKETKVAVFYIEGVKRGRELIKIARRCTKKKPIVIIKGGITEQGSKAASSHTASLAGSSEAYRAVFKQFGFIEAKDLKDLLNLSKIFTTQPLCTGKRVAIITNGGGAGVLVTDAIYNNGLELAELTERSNSELKKVMPKIVNVRMPLDMAGDADYSRFSSALDIVSKDENVDAIIAIALFQTPGADSKVASTLIDYGTKIKKPLIVLSIGGSYTKAHKSMIENGGVPVYDSPADAVSSLAALIRYSRYVNEENY